MLCLLSPSAMTASENTLETGNEGSSGAFIAVVASVVIVIAIIAALIGLFIYHRRNTQRVAQQAQRHPAGLICPETIFKRFTAMPCDDVLPQLPLLLLFIRHSYRLDLWLWDCDSYTYRMWALCYSFITLFSSPFCSLNHFPDNVLPLSHRPYRHLSQQYIPPRSGGRPVYLYVFLFL